MNPFCTARIRPGALPFLFSGGDSLDQLIEHLRRNRWWGQIIGPHGSGKSTLLATLNPQIEAAGRRVVLYSLHNNERRLPPEGGSSFPYDESTQIIVDGYEQLSRVQRWKLKRNCRRYGAGLLVTSHTDVGLPQLFCTEVTEKLVQQVVAQLLPNDPSLLSRDDIEAARRKHGEDLREILFELYDTWQAKSSAL